MWKSIIHNTTLNLTHWSNPEDIWICFCSQWHHSNHLDRYGGQGNRWSIF